MTRSDQINELAAALAKAQGAMCPAAKDGTNPHHRYKYATLGAIWEACREPLSANGLSITQGIVQQPGQVVVESLLMHSSGQWVSSSLTIPCLKAEAQGIGAAITYARKYALAAMVGVAPEDEESALLAKAGKPGMATEEQIALIWRLNSELAQEERILRAQMSRVYGCTEPYLLTTGQAASLEGDLRLQLSRRTGTGATDRTPPPPPSAPPAPPAGGASATLQEALAEEQRAGAANGEANDEVTPMLRGRFLDSMESFLLLRFPDSENPPKDKSDRAGARRAILEKYSVVNDPGKDGSVLMAGAESLERRVAELVEQRRLAGVTCAVKEVPAVMPASKS